jgi:uncharacterized protein
MVTALILGFAGSMHCLGMCGPIVLALPDKNVSLKISFYTGRIFYNFGRVITYVIMGFIFGALGQVISLAGFQSVLSIVLGVLVIASLFLPLSKTMDFFTNNALWKNTLGKLFRKKSYSALAGIGLLNGFLPCGLVYTALAGATASGDIFYAGAFMLMFGMGTIPALLVLAAIGKRTRINWQGVIKKALPAMAVILGSLLILRGLSLGIPYISPDLSKQGSKKELFIPQCH